MGKKVIRVFLIIIFFLLITAFLLPMTINAVTRGGRAIDEEFIDITERKEIFTDIDISITTTSSLSQYTDQDDTTLDKVGKFFRHFEPDYMKFNITSDGKEKISAIYTFDVDDNGPYLFSDINNTIIENFREWSDVDEDYEIEFCDFMQIKPAILPYDSCSLSTYIGLLEKKSCPADSFSVYYNFDEASDKIRVRVAWYEEVKSGIHHLYPLITLCAK